MLAGVQRIKDQRSTRQTDSVAGRREGRQTDRKIQIEIGIDRWTLFYIRQGRRLCAKNKNSNEKKKKIDAAPTKQKELEARREIKFRWR